MMPAATGMLAVIKASLRMLSRPMSGSASISPSSASPKQVDDVGGDRDARGDQSGRRSMICTPAFFGAYPNVAVNLNAGKLRALATASRTRIESLPDVPTIVESGYEDYEANLWFGLFAPAKTPKDTVSQLAGWFSAALQASEVKVKLIAQGLYPAGICGADFRAFIRRQYDEYGRVIRESNIKAE
jgi:hypothetical protein